MMWQIPLSPYIPGISAVPQPQVLFGLSSDPKPAMSEGSCYIELDTGKVFAPLGQSWTPNAIGETGPVGQTGQAGPSGQSGVRGSQFLGGFATVAALPVVNGSTVMVGDFAFVNADGGLYRLE